MEYGTWNMEYGTWNMEYGCQVWDKIMEFGPNQVHMAPFGPILSQNRSHMVWDASRMPPGAPGAQRVPKRPKGAPPIPGPICCGVALKGLLHWLYGPQQLRT